MASAYTLTAALAGLLVSGAAIGLVGTAAASVENTSMPDDGPAYGVNNRSYQQLWSGDSDNGQLSGDAISEIPSEAAFARRLAQSTDIPAPHPPHAAAAWTRGDFQDYTPGGPNTSVHPAGATLSDSVYIKDAFVSIYAVQPSTRFHDGNGTTRYIRPDGNVLALGDYRIATPEANQSGPTRVQWSVVRTSMESVTLSTGNRTLDTATGKQATLQYANLTGNHTLSFEATITADLRKVTRICSRWNTSTTSCAGSWERSATAFSTSKTVSTATSVTSTHLENVSGRRVRFSTRDERGGAVVRTGVPWTTLTVDNGARIHSNVWFYTAGTPGWETIQTSNRTATTESPSSVRPVQVHAFPRRGGTYVAQDQTNGTDQAKIVDMWGDSRHGPQLPTAIDVDPASTYQRLDSIAVTSPTLADRTVQNLTVTGIVAGQSRTVPLAEEQLVRETDLTVTIAERNATHAVVEVSVSENATGTPVSTGHVSVAGQTIGLNQGGVGVATISNPSLLVRGAYQPSPWWQTNQAYSSATDLAKTHPTVPAGQTIIDLVVVTMLWFFPVGALVFGLEYMTGGELLGLSRRNNL